MSDDGENSVSRWSRRKRDARAGRPLADAPQRDESTPPTPGKPAAGKHGGAAPTAGRRLVPSMQPLAGAEDDPDDPYRSEPIVQAYGLPPEPVATGEADDDAAEEQRELTPEEQEAVKNLPPIEALNKDSDFTPFLAKNVPDFLRRKALKVLWRSDPVLANLDGLNDYDGDYGMAAVIAEALEMTRDAERMAKAAAGKGKVDSDRTTGAAEKDDVQADDRTGDQAGVGDADGEIVADADMGEAENDVGTDDPDTPPRMH